MKFDLHCHSHFSDGNHPPEFLIQRAIANNVTHLAITDHDCVQVFKQPVEVPQELTLIPGVEISCTWNGQEIHVVGLGIDVEAQQLTAILDIQQKSRRERAATMAKRLASFTDYDLESYLESLPCISRTRSHIANFLVKEGASKNHQQAFKKYLSRKGKLYCPANWCDLETAISSINAAGGIAVVAHPSRYPFTRKKLLSLLSDFKQAGGAAIETAYSNLDPLARKKLEDACDEMDMYASCGSDFHSIENTWTDIGKFHSFAESKKNSIWNHPRWHFSHNSPQAV
jgi:predicted metal-dependent phosphoesterase TrpH